MRKECEAAKKKTKDTLERYFSESDRLKAIIDEMHGTLSKLLVPEVAPFVSVVNNMAKSSHSKRQQEIP